VGAGGAALCGLISRETPHALGRDADAGARWRRRDRLTRSSKITSSPIKEGAVRFLAVVIISLTVNGVAAAGPQAGTAAPPNLRQLQQAASRGAARAQFDLGTYYARTDVPEHDDMMALQWLQKSAEQNLADAQHALAMMYLDGRGTKQDLGQTAVWSRKAAEQGVAPAQYSLAFLYSVGAGVTQDDTQAVAWWRKSADQGFANGQNMLGVMYFGGTRRGARRCAGRSVVAQGGRAGAGRRRVEPGVAYAAGRGVEFDLEQATQWWRKAADAGNVAAMNSLAGAYSTGSGVEKSPSEAARLWRQAADLGDPSAQHSLGVAYHDGAGVPKDFVESYKWLYIAVARSSASEQRSHMIARDAVGTNMTSEELGEAQKRAKAWLDGFYPPSATR
jgi:TPR repeat protein